MLHREFPGGSDKVHQGRQLKSTRRRRAINLLVVGIPVSIASGMFTRIRPAALSQRVMTMAVPSTKLCLPMLTTAGNEGEQRCVTL